MANTLTDLIPDAYAALDVVSRELAGAVLAVTRDSRADRVAKNQTLRIPITPENTAGGDITPAMAFPAAADQTLANAELTISKFRFYPFSWSGEEEGSMNVQGGPGVLTLQQAQIAQAMRKLVNEMETDIMVAGAAAACRAYGTSGTAPFATAGNWADLAAMAKILDDNGADPADRQLVINTAAAANIRGLQAQLQMTGDVPLLKQGIIDDRLGFAIRQSAQVVSHTAGSGSSATTDATGYAAKTKVLTLASAGTGTILAGDIISHARDTRKYVVAVDGGDADVSGGGTFTINPPGVMQSITAATSALTIAASYSANLAFPRSSILFATRLPATPARGDLAADKITVTDPRTGIAFEIAWYPGLDMGLYRVRACWGVVALNNNIAILQG